MTERIDDKFLEPERSPELQAAIRKLVDEVHELLGRQNGCTQPDGNVEMQKVVLTIPRAYAELAAFLAVVDEEDCDPMGLWGYVKTTPDDRTMAKNLNHMRNLYLQRILEQWMSMALDMLVHGELQLNGTRGL